jgi:hypothetical protein
MAQAFLLFCFSQNSASAAAGDEYKRDDYDPDAVIVEKVAQAVIHIRSSYK